MGRNNQASGNSSIANEWGQWRYFNSAFEKLGTAKPAMINTKIDKGVPRQEVEWIDCFKAVFAAGKAFEKSNDKRATKVVEDYLKTHSLEEYRNEMLKGAVPFQDDPVAMSKLKQSHGAMLASYIEQDFKRRVETNEFAGMTPEQVDAEYFKFHREQAQGVAKQFGYDDNDPFFKQGLFGRSPESRIGMITKQKEVENDYQVQQMFIQGNAEVVAFLSNPNVNAEGLVSKVQEFYKQAGWRLTPDKADAYYNNILQTLVKHPNGLKILQDLKDRKDLPFSNGKTIGEYLGEDRYKETLVNVANYNYVKDVKARQEFESSVLDLAHNGEISRVKALFDSEVALTGGQVETDKIKFLRKALDTAQATQRSSLQKAEAKAATEAKKALKVANAMTWLKLGAKRVYVKQPGEDGADFSGEDITEAYGRLVEEGQLTFEEQIALASNPDVYDRYNPARTFFKNHTRNAMNLLEGHAENFYRTGKLEGIPTKPPEDVQLVLELYTTDPDNFRTVVGGMGNESVNQLEAVAVLAKNGRSYQDIVRGKAATKELQKTTEGRAILSKWKDEVAKATANPVTSQFNSKIDSDGKNFIYMMALNFVACGETPNSAMDKAQGLYQDEFVQFGGSSIPKSFFTSEFSNGVDLAKKLFDEKVLTPQMAKQGVRAEYDWVNNAVVMRDLAGNEKARYTRTNVNNAFRAMNFITGRKTAEARHRITDTPSELSTEDMFKQ